MTSALAFMKNTVANAKGIIQEAIEYKHITNAEVIETTITTATVIALQNITYKGEYIQVARRFIVSPRLEDGILLDALKQAPKENDIIFYQGEEWIVKETPVPSSVEIDILCAKTGYRKTTKSVKFK
jgi:hypothetical protein